MSLKIIGPFGLEKKFKDETAFRDFQQRLFLLLPKDQRIGYAQDYRKIFGEGETPDFHDCVEKHCLKVEQYLQTVSALNTPHVLPDEITMLKQRHSRLIQLLTKSNHLSHTLAGPRLYEAHAGASDLHEAFHEERNVAPTAPIHHKLHFLLRDGEILMFLPWIQKLVLSGEVEKPVEKIHEPKNLIPTAFSVLGKLQGGLKAYITGGSKGDLKNTLAEIKAQLQDFPGGAQMLKEEEEKLKKKKF